MAIDIYTKTNWKRETAMCCGVGGELMWMEDTGTRINKERTEQLYETNATMISTGCPNCLTMISDGTKAKEIDDKVQTVRCSRNS